jgi:hypothetical protein
MAEKRIPWHEDNRFWQTLGPILFSEPRIQNAAMEVGRIAKLLHLRRGAHVLDLCCGFSVPGVYGSMDGEAYGPVAQRLVVVARKP